MSQMIADCKQCANLQKENVQLRKTHDEILEEMIKRTAYLCKFYDQFPEKDGHELLQKMTNEVQEEKQRFDEEMEALKKRNQSLEARIATQEMSAARLRQQLTEAQKKIVELEEEFETDSEEDKDEEEEDESDDECCCDCHCSDSEEEDDSDDDDYDDSDDEEDTSDEEDSDDEELNEQLQEAQTKNAHLQEELDKAVKEIEQLREENEVMRENERQLEDRLDRATDELFRYIVRYPQFVQHKTVEEAQVEINDLRCEVARLEEEKKQQSEIDDWEEVATARISDFSEESSISSNASILWGEEEKEDDTQEESEDDGDFAYALDEAKKETPGRRHKLDYLILFGVFFFTFSVVFSLMSFLF